MNDKNLPLIGFFPLFYNLAETGRAILVAQQYEKAGGKAIFFSHGGKYERLAEENGFKVIRLKPRYTEKYIDLLWASSRMETLKNPFTVKILEEHIEQEVTAFKKTKIKLLVSTNSFPCYITARIAKIPLISITTNLNPTFKHYPKDADFFLIKLVPEFIKKPILNYYAPRSKVYVRPFQKLAKKYNVKSPKTSYEISKGDYTFYVDYPVLYPLSKRDHNKNRYFVGLSFFDDLISKNIDKKQQEKEEKEIMKHIKNGKRSILLSLGSSGLKTLFLKILKTLEKTDYQVIAIYTSIFKEDEKPNLKDNILLKKFVPSIQKINNEVDLAILSGGKGTIYTAAYAGKPVIGFPMQYEQYLNLQALAEKKMAKIMSTRYYKEKDMLKTLNEIFDNYDYYLKNALKIAKVLPKPEGEKKSVELILKIMKEEKII